MYIFNLHGEKGTTVPPKQCIVRNVSISCCSAVEGYYSLHGWHVATLKSLFLECSEVDDEFVLWMALARLYYFCSEIHKYHVYHTR